MIPLTDEENKSYKKYAIYAKKVLVLIIIIKSIIKSVIYVTTQEHILEQLIMFVI